jgi:hypothetical protein
MHKNKTISKHLRYKILSRDAFKCRICGIGASDGTTLHVDHIIPQSKGGLTEDWNLQCLCIDCNLGKSNRDPVGNEALGTNESSFSYVECDGGITVAEPRWWNVPLMQRVTRAVEIAIEHAAYPCQYNKSKTYLRPIYPEDIAQTVTMYCGERQTDVLAEVKRQLCVIGFEPILQSRTKAYRRGGWRDARTYVFAA